MTEPVEMVDVLVQRMGELQRCEAERDRTGRHARMRARVIEQVEWEAETLTSPWRGWGLMRAAAVLVSVALLVWWSLPTPLTYEIEPRPDGGEAHSYVVTGDSEGVTMRFSDGSVVELRPSTSLRVGQRHENGADLELVRGAIELRLETQPGTWLVEAGPYRAVALGTAMRAEWHPSSARFELEARHGRVEVRGPGIEGTRVLEEGEHLSLGDRSQGTVVAQTATPDQPTSELGPSAESTARARTRSPASPEPLRQAARRPSADDRDTPANPADDWRFLARRGAYREALSVAESLGFAGLCASLSANALLELADVGRYARQPARAREALMALRDRFPGTDAAASAAFDLGRLETTARHDCTSSTQWFRTYLAERPRGPMAEAARGRLEECTTAARPEPGPGP